jgi:hypothetical protein
MVRQSDAFDDDADHWGLVDAEQLPELEDQDQVPAPWGFILMVAVLMLAVFVIWTDVFRGG